ncbi:hypothetical protein EV09_1589 [Prochlorococcus marinus str. SS35]|nr:hypothetical protein EV09_1589 [Prochlorococcus marinus str. SS35]
MVNKTTYYWEIQFHFPFNRTPQAIHCLGVTTLISTLSPHY